VVLEAATEPSSRIRWHPNQEVIPVILDAKMNDKRKGTSEMVLDSQQALKWKGNLSEKVKSKGGVHWRLYLKIFAQ
jgi:hypothetical protein